ncbi:MAG TPA: bile acid:sodium symporter, partial [Sphingorhabdus sp.]|nr:bile acid:sodium symporter [Sphingorhabdus sp.]
MTRLVPDRFVLLLLGAVLVGWLLPVSGTGFDVARDVSFAGIFALFFLHGLKLPRHEVAAAMKGWRVQGAMLAFTFVAMPLLGLALAQGAKLLLPEALAIGLLFTAILPSTAQSAISYTSLARGNVAASVVGAALSNLAGIMLTPLLFVLLLGAAGASVGTDAIMRIATMLLLPFVLGQMMQRWFGAWAARQKSLLTMFDRGVILLAVYVAFSSAVSGGALSVISLPSLLILLLLAALFLAAAFAGAWGLGLALRFARGDRISLLFAGAHKGIVTGAPMAALLFPAEVAGLMIL